MLSAAPGVELGLDELLEMRHRLHEARLFSSQNRRSPLVGLHHSRLRDAAWTSTRCASTSPATTYGPSTGASPRAPASRTPLFHEERERPVFVLVEQSQRLFFGSGLCFKAVLAARAAAFIGWSALAHNDRIGGLVFSDRDCHEIKPRRSKHSLLQLFNQLLRANRELRETPAERPGELFGLALRRAREVLRPGSLILVLCDERTLNDVAEQQLSLIARHTDLVLLPLSDPLDHALPPPDCCASAKAPPTSSWTPTPTSCARPIANWPRRALAAAGPATGRAAAAVDPGRPGGAVAGPAGTTPAGVSRMNPLDRLEPLIAPARRLVAASARLVAAGRPAAVARLGALATAPAPAAAHHRHPRRSAGSAARSGPGRTGRACQALRQGFRRALAAGHQRPAQAGLQGALAR